MDILAVEPGSLVMMVGPAGSGKSTLAHRLVPALSNVVVSSDLCRQAVCGDIENQKHNEEAYALRNTWVEQRLKLGHMTIADSTNLKRRDRQVLIDIARKYNRTVYAIWLDVTLEQCLAQNAARTRRVPEDVVRNHFKLHTVSRLELPNEVDQVFEVLGSDYRILEENSGLVLKHHKWAIIGDVHGCHKELKDLLRQIGIWYNGFAWESSLDYRVAFVGDLVDRGPYSMRAVLLVEELVNQGLAVCVSGNHDYKAARAMNGANVNRGRNLQQTMEQWERQPAPIKDAIKKFLTELPPYVTLLDNKGNRFTVSHAGMPKSFLNRMDDQVLSHCRYGEVLDRGTKTRPPTRGLSWCETWPTEEPTHLCVYGHIVEDEPTFRNNTLNIDQGCVFGGKLTAFLTDTGEFIQVNAAQTYSKRHEGDEV